MYQFYYMQIYYSGNSMYQYYYFIIINKYIIMYLDTYYNKHNNGINIHFSLKIESLSIK